LKLRANVCFSGAVRGSPIFYNIFFYCWNFCGCDVMMIYRILVLFLPQFNGENIGEKCIRGRLAEMFRFMLRVILDEGVKRVG
jgi:hypothetical protein